VNQTFYYNQRFQPAVMYAYNSSASSIAKYCYDFHLPGGGTIGDLNLFCNFSVSPHGNNGNLYKVTNNLTGARTANYKYDFLNRIQQAYTNGTNWGETYTIDTWGNLTNRDPVSGKTNYEPLAAPALTTNQLTGFSYDAAGNLISDGSGDTYTYDAENRLVTANVASTPVTYSYDGDGNRVVKSNGTIYWRGLGDEVLAESDLSGNVSEEYVYVNGKRMLRVDRPSGVDHVYFEDFVGSTTLITDINGNPQLQSDYYPFGGIAYSSGSDPNHYMFTGKERDSESALDNFGARYYTSNTGRFMTPDWAARPTAVPYAMFGDPQSLNLYNYVRNDPVSRADADGHCIPDASMTGCADEQSTGTQEESEKEAEKAASVENNQQSDQNAAPVTATAAGTTTTAPVVLDKIVVIIEQAAQKGPSFLLDALGNTLGAAAFVVTGGVGHTANEAQDTTNQPATAAGGAGKGKKPHGNTAGSQPAELYALLDKNGKFLKWGVSQDASTRYSKEQLNGGRTIVIGRGARSEMLWIERALTEKYPGGWNFEAWAGSAK
jgi:RHS repeat-associated protein